ncbi:cytochrome P450 [Streptomyces montanisoli]|uniref:cytochrome P450 n=1 Tax=Streptomyces montanisoli TaxID=2798581 RepID=UPI0027DDFD4F|nr:cytochrome P450 [Streptomyces montanisoli]
MSTHGTGAEGPRGNGTYDEAGHGGASHPEGYRDGAHRDESHGGGFGDGDGFGDGGGYGDGGYGDGGGTHTTGVHGPGPQATGPYPARPACPVAHGGASEGLGALGATARPVPLTSVVSSSDPHEVYRELRTRHGALAPVELEPGLSAWLVMGYPELLVVTRMEQLFSRDPRNWHAIREQRISPDSPLMPMMRYHPVCYHEDGAEHRRMRAPFDEGVGRLNERAARRQIESRCHGLVAKFAAQGRADLVSQYAALAPMMSLAGLFGLDTARSEELVRTVYGVVGSGPDSETAYQTQHRIIGDMLSRPRRAPEQDLTWTFAHHPNLRTDEERFAAMHLTLIAANMPAISWIAHTLRMMITDPRFAAQVRGGRLGVDDALDEALWREPPMHAMPARYVLHDTTLGGRRLRRGDCLVMGIAAANDDPRIGPDESEDWGNRAHLAFSAGPHRCPAQLPARLIARTAVRTVLNLLPDIELTVLAADLAPSPSPWTRVPAHLPVSFTPVTL